MKIFLLADYYPEYLNAFYALHKMKGLPYEQNHKILLADYFGSFVSYYNHFRKIGHEVRLIIGNDVVLQEKWLAGQGMSSSGLSKYDIVLSQVKEFQPDVFFMGSMFDYYGDFLKSVSKITKNIFTWIACPYPERLDFSHITCVISSVDSFVTRFREKNLNAESLKAAFDSDIINYLDNKKSVDVSFIGGLSTKTHSRRVKGLEHLVKRGIKLKTFGYGMKKPLLPFMQSPLTKTFNGAVWGIEMYRTLNRSKISLNFHIDIAKSINENMRLFEATGCGSLLMTENTPDLGDKFVAGKEIVAYENFDDLADKIRYYLLHENELETISAAGRKACTERHGYDKRIKEFERILLKYCS